MLLLAHASRTIDKLIRIKELLAKMLASVSFLQLIRPMCSALLKETNRAWWNRGLGSWRRMIKVGSETGGTPAHFNDRVLQSIASNYLSFRM